MAITVGLATLATFFGWQWYRVTVRSQELAAEVTAVRAQLATRTAPKVSAPAARGDTPLAKVPILPATAQAGDSRASVGFVTQSDRKELDTILRPDEQLRQMVALTLASMPDLPEELGLTKDETREFLTLMFERMQRAQSETQPVDLAQMGKDPAARKRFMERAAVAQKDAEMLAAGRFGQATVDKFKDYQHLSQARQSVSQLQLVLIENDLPLSADQRRQLTTAYTKIDRELSAQRDQSVFEEEVDVNGSAGSTLVSKYFAEREKRLAAETLAVLTSEQKLVWDKQQALQLERRTLAEAFMRQARSRAAPPR
jgi:hypothetical protein